MKRILSLVLVCMMALSVTAVAGAEDVILRMAVGYNNANTGLAFSADIAGEGITLADGITYHTGDLKPTWVEMEKVLNAMPNADGRVKAEKVLEISAEHKILDKLETLFSEDKETLKKYSTVLYEQARILEGLSIDDVSAFVNALSDIM